MRQSQRRLTLDRPCVVGIILSERGIDLAPAAMKNGVESFEIRLDAFQPASGRVQSLHGPVLLTARRPDEGAVSRLDLAERRRRCLKYLPFAAAIDTEVRSSKEMAAVIREARSNGLDVILSYHNFARTPPARRLMELERKAKSEGATIFKVATQTVSLKDVATLMAVLDGSSMPMAAMGMGPFGKVARLVLAKGGSVLNYGWLEESRIPGQWAAVELVERMREVE